ncbi:MAG TPA: hypothetical protein VD861_08160, partial [Pyrinomonadaceae bacterium]|nr:hypothetical protein [Pyrinomonadaceae bacterium]
MLNGQKEYRALAMVFILCLLPLYTPGQNPSENLRDQHFRQLKINAQEIRLALAELSNEYEVPIGIELVSENSRIPDVPINVGVQNATLEDVLNEITRQDSNYMWQLEDGVVNVFPRVNRDEFLADLLSTRVGTCLIKQDIQSSSLRILLTSLPEIELKAQMAKVWASNPSYTGSDYSPIGLSRPLKLSNATLREILNTVIRNSRTKIWT